MRARWAHQRGVRELGDEQRARGELECEADADCVGPVRARSCVAGAKHIRMMRAMTKRTTVFAATCMAIPATMMNAPTSLGAQRELRHRALAADERTMTPCGRSCRICMGTLGGPGSVRSARRQHFKSGYAHYAAGVISGAATEREICTYRLPIHWEELRRPRTLPFGLWKYSRHAGRIWRPLMRDESSPLDHAVRSGRRRQRLRAKIPVCLCTRAECQMPTLEQSGGLSSRPPRPTMDLARECHKHAPDATIGIGTLTKSVKVHSGRVRTIPARSAALGASPMRVRAGVSAGRRKLTRRRCF
jgi:hypothetical protein